MIIYDILSHSNWSSHLPFLQFPSELDPWKMLQEHILSDYLSHEVRICFPVCNGEQLNRWILCMLIVFWWHRKPQYWWFRFWLSDCIPGDFQILSVLSLALLCYILVSKMMNDIPTWFKSHFIWSLSLMLSGTWVDCAGSLQAIRGGRSRTRFLLVNYCCVCIWKFLGGCGKYSLFFNNLNRLFTWKFLRNISLLSRLKHLEILFHRLINR